MLQILPTTIEPAHWLLAFHRRTPHPLVGMLAFGRYKHVSALTWIEQLAMWLVYDVTLAGSHILLVPDTEAGRLWLSERVLDARIVRMRKRPVTSGLVRPFSCVSAIAHLVGVAGGPLLRPDTLMRRCLESGGVIIAEAKLGPEDFGADGDARAARAARAG